jgi:hypothetical protein
MGSGRGGLAVKMLKVCVRGNAHLEGVGIVVFGSAKGVLGSSCSQGRGQGAQGG